MSANDPDRVDPPRDRLDRRAAQGERPFLGVCLGAQMMSLLLGRARSGRIRNGRVADRLLSASAQQRPAARSGRTGRRTSITGIARALICPRGANCWRRVAISRSKHSASRPFVRLSVSSRRDLRDDASLDHARPRAPRSAGARPRHHHFADRAVHDVTERAWLKAFLDGWLARTPPVAGFDMAMAQAAE